MVGTIATSPEKERVERTAEAPAPAPIHLPEPRLPAWMGVNGFVDIHFHLLWGLDDGPDQVSVSSRLGELAYQRGARAIVATPHCSARYPFDAAQTAAKVALLDRSFEEPAIFAGCEIELNDESLRRIATDPRRYCLAGGCYALVELPHRFPHDRLGIVFHRLRDLGLRPILAHPERYPLLWDHPELAVEWTQAGGYLQLTAAAFTGRFGRRAESAAVALVQAGCAHFVASDAHDLTKRPPDLQAAFERVYQLAGQSVAARLFTYHPLAVLHDDPLPSV
ncbi:MAG: hypothetical protein GC160_29305 [Acidobacteria bacterium]|nr:hypothetical protein [Acidobacteriota bacterium]